MQNIICAVCAAIAVTATAITFGSLLPPALIVGSALAFGGLG